MHDICVAYGDGIGPEIMEATLSILKAAKAPLNITEIEVGEKVYLAGEKAGISEASWAAIKKAKAFLKAPITTPQGGGFKSLNVKVRTTLGLYANVRPCQSLAPYIATKHPKMDVVIVRENEEDLYAGIEYRQTDDVYQALKIISSSGSEKIIRFAFEYAKAHCRKKVTCFTKDNILKFSDGQFHKVFQEIAKEYPELENEHWIVDIGAAKLADTPENFDVVVLPNLYGDILSDVAAQITGSVGLAGSANIGEHGAMFEAIHGSAPKRAGQNKANPSGLLLAAVMMLDFLGEGKIASDVHNAWLKTVEDGVHTYDIFKEGVSVELVGTKEFADQVIERLGKMPTTLAQAKPPEGIMQLSHRATTTPSTTHKELEGVDVFIDWKLDVEKLLLHLKKCETDKLHLACIMNRGVEVWPQSHSETALVDHWRCRFLKNGEHLTFKELIPLLHNLPAHHLDFTQVEVLRSFDSHLGYTLV